MRSVFEVLSPEILFEIFDYLTPYDIFHSWINLNRRLNDIIRLYPLQLDFCGITRSKFDWLCRYMKPEQVISLNLSEEMMPNQVKLFSQYFPNLQQQFLSLKTIRFINTLTILSDLPVCLSSLSIKTYSKTATTDYVIRQILTQQAKYLTYLQVDGYYAFRSVNTSFPYLTHLIIDYCTITEFHRILHHLQSPLIYLRLFLDKEENVTVLNFEHLCHSLVHLSLFFSEDILMSFAFIEQSIRQLYKLTCLTIQATGTFDLMNGQTWEEYLLTSTIKKFNFKFSLASHLTCSQEKNSLLESFRSSFWLEKHHWYVACEKGNFKSSRPTIYSIPYFQSSFVFYPSNHFLLVSTAEKEIPSNRLINLILTFHKTIIVPTSPFSNVYSLTLLTTTLPSVDLLRSIVHLQQIHELDVSLIRYVPADELQRLIHEMKNLKRIKMQYNPLFLPPLHIDSYIFIRNDSEIFIINANNIQRFCYLFFHLKYLEVTVESKEIVIQLLRQLHYLEIVKIYCHQDSLSNIKYLWFRQNIPRLNTNCFTYRITSSCILLSIGDRKVRFEKNIF